MATERQVPERTLRGTFERGGVKVGRFSVEAPRIVHTIRFSDDDPKREGGFDIGLIDLYMYWASALINGDYSGIEDDEEGFDAAACRAVEAGLSALGWQIVHPQEYGEEPYECDHEDWEELKAGGCIADSFFGEPEHSPHSGEGDILTYVCHRYFS